MMHATVPLLPTAAVFLVLGVALGLVAGALHHRDDIRQADRFIAEARHALISAGLWPPGAHTAPEPGAATPTDDRREVKT